MVAVFICLLFTGCPNNVEDSVTSENQNTPENPTQFTVTFDLDGGKIATDDGTEVTSINVQAVESGKTATKPTVQGTFKHDGKKDIVASDVVWLLDGKQFDFATTITKISL